MSNSPHPEQGTTRRAFLKAAVATAAIATTGVGATLVGRELLNQQAAPASPVFTVSNPPASSGVFSTPLPPLQIGDNSELARQLAASQVEVARLQSELALAQQRIVALEQGNSASGDQQGRLQNELSAANERVGVLAGLVALYERATSADLDSRVRNGLHAVGTAVGSLTDDLPSLGESLAAGRQALNRVESQVPLVEAGRRWLLDHLARIMVAYTLVQTMLQAAVDRVGNVLAMLTDWLENVLKWLPSGMQTRTRDLVNAIGTLLDTIPATTSGAQVNLLGALALWLGSVDEERTPMVDDLIRPIRDQLLVRVDGAVAHAATVREKYQNDLAAPVMVALETQQALRDEINAYRTRHGV
jgi:flagellar motor protein MotB